MLSENEMTGYAPLAEPRTVRLRFGKTGPLQYISHLEHRVLQLTLIL